MNYNEKFVVKVDEITNKTIKLQTKLDL